jgi:hypothetical protein
MIDSDNVLLLRPTSSASGFCLDNVRRSPLGAMEKAKGLLVVAIYHLAGRTGAELTDLFEREIEPELTKTGASVLASFVTESHPNTFPALPVREDANVFVSFSLFTDRATYEQHAAAFASSMRGKELAAKQLSGLIKGQPEILMLAPTPRSLLHG